MKQSLLLFVILVVSLCCKSRKDQDIEDIQEAGNYVLIDNERYSLDSLSVTYQNVPEGRSYQIMAINRANDVFVAIQYLILNTNEDFPAGEFVYDSTDDLKNLQSNRFHNILVRYVASNGAKVLLDGLTGVAIEGGVLKVTKNNQAYDLVAASTIGGRKVMFKYGGKINSEEFDW